MPTTQLTVHQVLTDQSVDMALTLTAQMFGLSKATVTQIVQVGLPLIAHMTRTNPELLQRLHALARAPIPEPIQDFYVRQVVKLDDGTITNKLVGKVFEDYHDAYAEQCAMK